MPKSTSILQDAFLFLYGLMHVYYISSPYVLHSKPSDVLLLDLTGSAGVSASMILLRIEHESSSSS